MKGLPGKHASLGNLFASARLDELGDTRQHLEDCRDCAAVYESYRVFVRDQRLPDFEAFSTKLTAENCRDGKLTAQDHADYFLAFQAEHSPRHAVQFVKHMNDCFSCLLAFSMNWTDYLFRIQDKNI